MNRKTSAALLALITAGTSSLGSAQPASPPDQPARAAETEPGPSMPSPPPKRAVPRRSTASSPKAMTGPVATFPGFQALPDGRSQIYVEITSPVPVAESVSPGAVTYRLKGARVTVGNNKNSLITTHFPSTPVARARLVPTDGDLNLIIDLRAKVTATYRMVSSEAGTARLEVEFQAGQFPTEPLRFMPPAKEKEKEPAAKDPQEGTLDTVDERPEKASPTTQKPKKKTAKPKVKGMGPPVP